MNFTPNLADKGLEIVLGDRNDDYGDPRQDFEGIALMWTGLLNGKLNRDITASDVALMMIALKLRRHCHNPKDDNLIDGHGYLHCLNWIEKGMPPEPKDNK